jgi:uncharacterized hydrophobic protein (TIGR00271 family)
MGAISEFLHGGVVDESEILRIRDTLLFEEPERNRKLTRFFALLVLASAISTFGLIADSVATVIGAMIVAPLMLPIMGLAFGVSLGDRRAILRSLTISLLGIGTAIAVGYLLTWPMNAIINPEANTQIMTRTAPRLIDLLAALATGLAGAFATGRKDVSDTLPGVAIAISLVPPLANVGILLATGRTDLAMGSLLLFVTNYLAILLTGSFMFGIMGYPRAFLEERSRRAKGTAIAIAVVLVTAIILPLGATSFRTIIGSIVEQRTADAAEAWLEGSGYRFVSVRSEDGETRLVVAGQGDLPPQAALKEALDGEIFGLPVILEVLPETVVTIDTLGPGEQ